MSSAGDVLLDIADLGRSFGGVAALRGVSFQLRESEILGLIGPNGSGKSTAVDCITGFTTPDEGRVCLDGRDLGRLSPDAIARAGIARTFQAITLYDQLTLDEHLELAHRGLRGDSAADADIDWVAEFGLDDKRTTPAGFLSYGQKKLVALATVLSVRPRIAMLDEPLAGVNPRIVEIIRDAILAANARGQTFLIVEHNVEFITSCCSGVVVLDAGCKLAEGPPSVIWDDPAVYEAFLGRRTTDV
jgi:branched-chain amino acid transport system ATP-binding protein